MAKPSDRRNRWHSAVRPAFLSLAVVAVLNGCASAGRPSAPVAVNARTFGDTSAYGLRINTLDPVQETAGAQLAQSAYVIVLAVRPGRDIELISPVADLPPATAKAGRLDVSMQRFEDDLTDLEAEDAKAQLAFDRCVSNAEAQARRDAEARARARQQTDSTGKVVSGGGTSGVDVVSTDAAARRCRAPRAARPQPKRLPPREPSERYLVVLASAVPMTGQQIEQRLGTLTTTASDVALTIEAIAAGLYAGLPGRYAGAYATW